MPSTTNTSGMFCPDSASWKRQFEDTILPAREQL
jgi:hypothetical protein